eukprot:TRINITY_DN6076_c0_g1_i1.p1 TRINITY_DN6076_c0_g1~~TRINITY_DN6076_c0_g1_i1.p1  ORF type:complete len:348 (+),score=93.26 TRINITY_DN6076_c0_g1_i1:60-1046(+)
MAATGEFDAIVVREHGPPSVLKLEKRSVPALTPTQILVKVHAVGVNPVETYIRSGSNNYGVSFPYTPGADCAGEVEAVGADVTRFKVGDRVWTAGTVTGSYAAKTVVEEKNAHTLPNNVSYEQGAGVNVPYATAYRALFQRSKGKPGQTVFVHGGSGGVGIAAVQFARAHGMIVIATASTEAGRKLVIENGAHHALDHKSDDYLQKLTELTGGKGPDVILEMLANVNLQKDLSVVAKFGKIAIIGNRGTIEINARDAMFRDADIKGVALANTPPEKRAEINAAIVAGLAAGYLKPIVGERFPLADAALAHEAVINHPSGSAGKIVLLP